MGVKEAEMRILAAILALFAVWAFTVARFEEWAYKRGLKEGYAKGRREINPLPFLVRLPQRNASLSP